MWVREAGNLQSRDAQLQGVGVGTGGTGSRRAGGKVDGWTNTITQTVSQERHICSHTYTTDTLHVIIH